MCMWHGMAKAWKEKWWSDDEASLPPLLLISLCGGSCDPGHSVSWHALSACSDDLKAAMWHSSCVCSVTGGGFVTALCDGRVEAQEAWKWRW